MDSVHTTAESAPSLAGFFAGIAERPAHGPSFTCESARLLRIDLDGDVWLKPGAAVAHRGAVRFERRHTVEAASVADAVLRETAPLVRATGQGRLFCAYRGSHVHVVRLCGDAVVVAWTDLLAFDAGLAFEPSLVAHGVGVAAGGMVGVRLSGEGSLALATHGEPLALEVTPGDPVSTDPHATVAWSATLSPTLRMDVSWRSLIGHGGQEPVQMRFDGNGVVVVQAFEDPGRFEIGLKPLQELAALFSL
jgi:uncharacterized protein (AIM24 family)